MPDLGAMISHVQAATLAVLATAALTGRDDQ
jgi:hypothetical protein